MQDLFSAIALALAIEGVLYALFPQAMQRFLARMADVPAGTLRVCGVCGLGLGVLIAWAARG
ncbi:MAG: DUF2065 domain-containing protein [Thalassobaculales bacterium]